MPPHCGNIGPWGPSAFPGSDDAVAPDLLSPELEHPATAGIRIVMADAASASAVTLRRTDTHPVAEPTAGHTMHCSGSPAGQPPTRPLSRQFNAFAGRGSSAQTIRRCSGP